MNLTDWYCPERWEGMKYAGPGDHKEDELRTCSACGAAVGAATSPSVRRIVNGFRIPDAGARFRSGRGVAVEALASEVCAALYATYGTPPVARIHLAESFSVAAGDLNDFLAANPDCQEAGRKIVFFRLGLAADFQVVARYWDQLLEMLGGGPVLLEESEDEIAALQGRGAGLRRLIGFLSWGEVRRFLGPDGRPADLRAVMLGFGS